MFDFHQRLRSIGEDMRSRLQRERDRIDRCRHWDMRLDYRSNVKTQLLLISPRNDLNSQGKPLMNFEWAKASETKSRVAGSAINRLTAFSATSIATPS